MELEVRIEITHKLEEPLQFSFVYTDGDMEEPLTRFTLDALVPAKKKFSVKVSPPKPERVKLSTLMVSSAIVMDVLYQNKTLSRTIIMQHVRDKLGQFTIPEDGLEVAEEDFNGGEDSLDF